MVSPPRIGTLVQNRRRLLGWILEKGKASVSGARSRDARAFLARTLLIAAGCAATTSCMLSGPGSPTGIDPSHDAIPGHIERRHEPLPTAVDEPVVLEVSDWITGMRVGIDEYVFDLSSLPMVQSDRFNEMEFAYTSSSSCDSDYSVWSVSNGAWEPVAYDPPLSVACLTVLTSQAHTIRDLYGDPRSFLDHDRKARVRTQTMNPRVRVLRLHPGYAAWRLSAGWISSFCGLSWDGHSFWTTSAFSDRIYEFDGGGLLLRSFPAPGNFPAGVTFGAGSLWIADGSDRIFQIDRNGNLACEFTVPTDYPGSLAWGGGSLWLSAGGPSPRLIRIDPSASCGSQNAVVIDEFETPGGEGRGLAWYGRGLLLVSDGLYEVDTEGSISGPRDLAVADVQGLAWEEGSVVMMSRGPVGVGNSGVKLARFRLR